MSERMNIDMVESPAAGEYQEASTEQQAEVGRAEAGSRPQSLQMFISAASSATATPFERGIVAGYAAGMTQAHNQALSKLQQMGALEASTRRCEEEGQRVAGRLRNTEMLLACTAGRHGGLISSLERRLMGNEAESRLWEERVCRLEGRLAAAEERRFPAMALRLAAASARGGMRLVSIAASLAAASDSGTRAKAMLSVLAAVEAIHAIGVVKRLPSLLRMWVKAARAGCWLWAGLLLRGMLVASAAKEKTKAVKEGDDQEGRMRGGVAED